MILRDVIQSKSCSFFKIEQRGKRPDMTRHVQDTKTTTPNQCHIDTTVPAIQAEQTEFDVAPATAEYVPAKASGQ